jgi:hypothetical protein
VPLRFAIRAFSLSFRGFMARVNTAGLAASKLPVGKITDLTDLLEFGRLTKLLDIPWVLLSLFFIANE